ncbi:hypothetical protein GOBAR_AA14413 [Gossypium barbadense]|uniref:Uncharacterized protein n=1 Tax=Gossypium barbadense TaxID=3634 RepID=A0A2P5XSB6_GOSBA|nr:hypothetical protein GOBAR_AA14413 [Gossypium barbadense]
MGSTIPWKTLLKRPIQVSYNVGVRHFTVHSYPLKKGACGFSAFIKPKRRQKDFRFLASSVEEAVQWVGGILQKCDYGDYGDNSIEYGKLLLNWFPYLKYGFDNSIETHLKRKEEAAAITATNEIPVGKS